jgi:GntR family transcriptional regulator/MocR family aminotransferase
MDLVIQLDKRPGTPVYRLVAEKLTELIITGRLAPGSPLPPSRELARMLGVSRETVVRGYEELITQDYAESRSTNGTFVKQAPSGKPTEERHRQFAKLAGAISDYSNRVRRNARTHATAGHLDALNFGAAPDNLLPTRIWRELLLKHCKVSTRLAYKPDAFGRMELRKVLAEYVRRTKGIECTVDQIVVCSQSVGALSILCRAFADAGDTVIIEEPGFGGVRDICIAQGCKLEPVPVDDDGLDIARLSAVDESARLAYVTPAHQDPTGAVMSLERRHELLKWARKNNAWIIEDDYDGHFAYGSKPLPPLAALDEDGRVLYLGSFWKVLYPLTLVSFIVVPPALIELVARAKALAEPDSEALEHLALADYISSGQFERHLRRVRKIYSEQRRALIFHLKQTFRDKIEIAVDSAGSHQLVTLTTPHDTDLITSYGLDAGLGISSTRDYYLSSPRKGEFIIDFSCLPEHEAEGAVGRFASLIL